MRTVAVYSDADATLPFVREADAAVRIGPAPARESYLATDRIIAAGREGGAHLVHPGYGFLAERPEFATAVEAAGLRFVGPPASVLAALGDKAEAKAIAERAKVPVLPGYLGDDQSDEAFSAGARAIAREAGYRNAGTVEFIVDQAGDFYFLEVNARLQVEHPVTEVVCGVDLVEQQLRVALGEQGPRDEWTRSGDAVEARIYAEDPGSGFLPSTGWLAHVRWPDGVREDAG